jgi:hypothetical protein
MRSLLTVVGVFGFLGFSASASAVTYGFAGSLCQKWDGGGCPLYYSSCNNASSGTITVDCPIDKHGGTISGGYVNTIDTNSSSNVSCQLCNYYPSGTSWVGSCGTMQYSSGSSGQNWLYFSGALPSTITTFYATAYYSCTLPASTAIASYYVIE